MRSVVLLLLLLRLVMATLLLLLLLLLLPPPQPPLLLLTLVCGATRSHATRANRRRRQRSHTQDHATQCVTTAPANGYTLSRRYMYRYLNPNRHTRHRLRCKSAGRGPRGENALRGSLRLTTHCRTDRSAAAFFPGISSS